jgi:hypothetical protein
MSLCMKVKHLQNATQNMVFSSKCYTVGIFSALYGCQSLYLDVLYFAHCLDVAGTTAYVLRVM